MTQDFINCQTFIAINYQPNSLSLFVVVIVSRYSLALLFVVICCCSLLSLFVVVILCRYSLLLIVVVILCCYLLSLFFVVICCQKTLVDNRRSLRFVTVIRIMFLYEILIIYFGHCLHMFWLNCCQKIDLFNEILVRKMDTIFMEFCPETFLIFWT